MSRPPRRWIAQEDEILRREVFTQSDGKVNWCAIAQQLPGRSNKDCRKRWHNAITEGLTKGQWTKEEDDMLIKGVEEFGQKWIKISQLIVTRSADQCAKRWQQSLDPNLDHSEWTENENELLLEAVHKFGRQWKIIQSEQFPLRSKNSLKNQFTILLRKNRRKHSHLVSTNAGQGVDDSVSEESIQKRARKESYISISDFDDQQCNEGTAIRPESPLDGESSPYESNQNMESMSMSLGSMSFFGENTPNLDLSHLVASPLPHGIEDDVLPTSSATSAGINTDFAESLTAPISNSKTNPKSISLYPTTDAAKWKISESASDKKYPSDMFYASPIQGEITGFRRTEDLSANFHVADNLVSDTSLQNPFNFNKYGDFPDLQFDDIIRPTPTDTPSTSNDGSDASQAKAAQCVTLTIRDPSTETLQSLMSIAIENQTHFSVEKK